MPNQTSDNAVKDPNSFKLLYFLRLKTQALLLFTHTRSVFVHTNMLLKHAVDPQIIQKFLFVSGIDTLLI